MTQSDPSSGTSRPPRIIHIIPRDGLGGAETAARSAALDAPNDCDFTLYFPAGASLAHSGGISTTTRTGVSIIRYLFSRIRDILLSGRTCW